MSGGMTPADVANEALDAIGAGLALGDLEEGTEPAQIILRKYGECLRQLLRAAHWDFARKQAPLNCLADITGNTPNVSTFVQQPWTYAYEYPTDCLKARFIPYNYSNPAAVIPSGNIQIPTTPLIGGEGQQPASQLRLQPTRFLVGFDNSYPPATPPGYETPGVSPQGRQVIYSNVRLAILIYTVLTTYPSMWDALFRAAFTAYLGAEIAIPIWTKKGDPKFGMQMRDDQAANVRDKVTQARIISGNEGFTSSDIRVDWMDGRRVGGTWGGGWNSYGAWQGGGPGVLGYGWDTLSVNGSSAF